MLKTAFSKNEMKKRDTPFERKFIVLFLVLKFFSVAVLVQVLNVELVDCFVQGYLGFRYWDYMGRSKAYFHQEKGTFFIKNVL